MEGVCYCGWPLPLKDLESFPVCPLCFELVVQDVSCPLPLFLCFPVVNANSLDPQAKINSF